MLIIPAYTEHMISSVLKKLAGNKPKKTPIEEANAVDISRAIPGYTPPVKREVAPKAETQSNKPAIAATKSRTPAKGFDDSSTPAERAEAAVASMTDKHDAWVQKDLANLQEAWASIREMDDLSNHLHEVRLCAHNLKGMAVTYGQPSISKLSSSLCRLLDSEHSGHQHALINLHIEACRAAYLEGNNTEGSDIVAQSVCVALETQVNRTLEA